MISSILWWTLKGSLICLIGFATTLLLRRSPAAVRHAVWTVAVCAQLALPFSAKLVPSRALEVRVPAAAQMIAPAADATSTPFRAARATGSMPAAEWRSWVVWALVTGALLALLRLIGGTIAMIVTSANASRVTEGEWLSAIHTRCAALRISRPVTVLWSSRLTLPVTWGFLYPIVLLPVSAIEWSSERRDHVLLHELAHIKRADALTQLAAQLALAMYWFNPFVWLAVHRLRAEAENACDDYVLRNGERPSVYATTLVRLVEAHHGTPYPAFASLSVGSRSDLEDRVAAITRPDRDASVRRALLAVAMTAMLAVVLPLSAIQRAIRETAAPSSSSSCMPATVAAFGGEMSGTLTQNGTTTHYFFLRPQPGRCVEASFSLDTSFTGDDRDVAASSDALVREKRGGVDRALRIRDQNGTRTLHYALDGTPAAFDDAGRRWYSELMPEVIRRTTAGVEARTRRILDTHGVEGLVRELARIPSSSVRFEYLVAAVSLRAETELPRRRVIELAETYLTFEPELATFLGKFATREGSRSDVLSLIVQASDRLANGADRATVIEALLKHKDPAVRLAGLEAVSRMPDEIWRRTLLERGAPFCLRSDQASIDRFFEQADAIRSPYERRALVESLEGFELSQSVRARVAELAR